MIDLLEIGINNLIANETQDEQELPLQLLSQPELLEQLFNDLVLETVGYGACQHGRCHIVSTLYNTTDLASGNNSRAMCRHHAKTQLTHAIQTRAAEIWSNESNNDTAIDVYRHDFVRELLVPFDDWPTIQPEESCLVCGDGIYTVTVGRAYDPVTAIDANNVEHIVHNNCSWSCNNCRGRYVTARFRRDDTVPPGVERSYVSLSVELGGTTSIWCQNCIQETEVDDDLHTDVCINCSNVIVGHTTEDLQVYSELHGEWVCQSCYDNGVDCDECGYTMYNGSYHECEYDDDCDGGDSNSGIHSYGYKPRPTFHGNKGPYMGFELEVEASYGKLNDGISIMYNMDPNEKRFYLKSDGSLDHGFEIVTHPHSLDEYHKLDWSWLEKLANNSFRSWNTSTCGLHVHIGLQDFIDENHQIRFTKFIYDNERQVKRIAGRSSNYAAFSDKGKVIPKIKLKWQDHNRYSAVNVQNENTLEVRVFRGSLRKERVLSAIEFTHAACEYTRNMKVVPKQKPFSWLRFTAFVAANDDKYPNLFTIMNETFNQAREIDNQQDGDDN